MTVVPISERWWTVILLVLLNLFQLQHHPVLGAGGLFGHDDSDGRVFGENGDHFSFANSFTKDRGWNGQPWGKNVFFPYGTFDGLFPTIRVAHVGNSIQSYGDTPRLLEQMLQTRFDIVVQDSMLRPGGTFKSMFTDGNNLQLHVNLTVATLPDGRYDLGAPDIPTLFDEHDWDFVILNDRSTNPAIEDDREVSLSWLEDSYAPIFPIHAKAVFLQTAADRVEDNRDATMGLGDFDEFTSKTREGYEAYVDLFDSMSIPAILAPIGDAYGEVRDTLGESMFDRLYSSDNIHPTPHGTWLQCCLLYCTMIKEEPPMYDVTWWSKARYLEGRDEQSSIIEASVLFPTDDEAEDLRQIAIDMCNL